MSNLFDDINCCKDRGIKLEESNIIICEYCKKKEELVKTLKIGQTKKFFCSDFCWDKWLNKKRNWFTF